MTGRTLPQWSVALVVAMTLGACASGSAHKYHDTEMDFGSVKTVAVLPFNNLSRDAAGGERGGDHEARPGAQVRRRHRRHRQGVR